MSQQGNALDKHTKHKIKYLAPRNKAKFESTRSPEFHSKCRLDSAIFCRILQNSAEFHRIPPEIRENSAKFQSEFRQNPPGILEIRLDGNLNEYFRQAWITGQEALLELSTRLLRALECHEANRGHDNTPQHAGNPLSDMHVLQPLENGPGTTPRALDTTKNNRKARRTQRWPREAGSPTRNFPKFSKMPKFRAPPPL